LQSYGEGALVKKHPGFIKFLSSRQIRLFLDTFLLGDGSVHKGMRIYYTSSKQMADDLQELILKTGNYASVSCRKKRGTKVWIENHWATRTADSYTINEWQKPVDIALKTNLIKKVPYEGNVYCVEIAPHHLIYTRRNGKCFWNGNSGVVDRLIEQGYRIIPVNVAEAPTIETEKFQNLRAQIFWNIREQIGNLCLPDNSNLVADLSDIRYKFSSNGKILIEGKEQMKARSKRSPDYADSLAIAYYMISQLGRQNSTYLSNEISTGERPNPDWNR